MALDNLLQPEDEACYIQAFCRHVIKEKSGNYPALKKSADGTQVYPGAAGITSNRGNKLLQKAELVTRQVMNSSKPLNEESVYYNGSEHSLLKRRKKIKSSVDEDDDGDEEVDLSKLVDVRKILTPISSLADVTRHDAIRRTFESGMLRDLSLQTSILIEKEQNSVMRYAKLLELFLGEHPEPLREDVLKLPMYDHNLKLPDEDNADDDEKDEAEQQQDTTERDNDGEDPFFALPRVGGPEALLSLLPSVNSPEVAEEAEATRQLAQIALQRNQEFIRNLQTVRSALVKANRVRERILSWSREYTGYAEDDVTVPNALRAVKRGLISATTNMSMGGGVRRSEEILEDDMEGG
ncbi:hypothetical protein HG536_0B02430 [Torulaspora globosa]|uniref:Transcriptional regulatory protein RXT2 N-terminal domain-containing protein n=1 Tax=Torulaspora globosa TaxID=48254 RepID=A0A7G3ZCZ4_9SACH|nr:uncharacterized protein HG536_0B02430 [Torulaspora globosa]QLL31380.1 hypothetical protein HG536_0B02430 [Torulaspora globosa]